MFLIDIVITCLVNLGKTSYLHVFVDIIITFLCLNVFSRP